MKRCDYHSQKRCYEVIAEGLCVGKECQLFSRVSQMIPKLKRFHELMARGVIPYTVWDFSEKAEEQREKQKQRAHIWLKLYPQIVSGLDKINIKGD